MDRPARLYLCARCREQVVLCSRCDRGNRYCGRQCRQRARAQARRETAQRYQRSWRGRLCHAQRSRRWRQRRAARDALIAAAGGAHNVTHQGSRLGVASAPLVAWTHDSATACVAGPATDNTAANAPPEPGIASPATTSVTDWACRHCGARQGAAVRLGFLRHGLPRRWRHDHSP
jgi:hypothetical protein